MSVIEINKANLESLVEHIHKAIEAKQDVFEFQGNDLYTPYACYLVQFMCSKLNIRNTYVFAPIIHPPERLDPESTGEQGAL